MTQQLDLMEVEIQSEAKRIAREMVRDPVALQSLLLEQAQLREKAEAEAARALAEAQGLRKQLEEYFGADGYIEAAVVAATLRLEYLTPSGKVEIMGRNYVLRVFEIDGIVISTVAGYRLSSEWEKSGRGITRIVTRNERMHPIALFNGKGLEYLINKYDSDDRTWYSEKDITGSQSYRLTYE